MTQIKHTKNNNLFKKVSPKPTKTTKNTKTTKKHKKNKKKKLFFKLIGK